VLHTDANDLVGNVMASGSVSRARAEGVNGVYGWPCTVIERPRRSSDLPFASGLANENVSSSSGDRRKVIA